MFVGTVILFSLDLVQLSLTSGNIDQQLLIKQLTESMYMKRSYRHNITSSYQQNFTSDPSRLLIHFNSSREIREIRHIGFLKVHKAGSTTMQNMFFRFGLKRNLTFVIPKNGNYFNSQSLVPVKKGGHYDILAIHSIFRKDQFDKILPQDKVNIGIVREPLDRMISAAYYYRDVFGVPYLKQVPKDNLIQELISHPEKYDRGTFSETKNSMGMDFGFASSTKANEVDKILERLIFLDNEFRLVLVVERFLESLVLMKRYLGWQMSDILFIPSNSHEHADVYLTEEQKARHKRVSFLDYAVYDFFSKIFDFKVQDEGPLFQEEVKQFEKVLQQTKSFCEQSVSDTYRLEIPASEWNAKFEVSPSDCELMKLGEIKFLQNLRTRQIQMNGGHK